MDGEVVGIGLGGFVIDGDRDGNRVARQGAVGERVGEAVSAHKIAAAGQRRRRVAERAVLVERQSAVRRGAGDGHGQRVAVGIVVEGQHARRRHRQRLAVADVIGGTLPDGRLIGDVDRHVGRRAGRGSVARRIREAVGADKSGVRCIGERAVGIQTERAVGRRGRHAGHERISLVAVVVGQHAAIDGHRQRMVVEHGVTVRRGHRRSVIHRQRHGGRRAGRAPFQRLIGEAVAPREAGRRRVAERAVGVQGQRAVGG